METGNGHHCPDGSPHHWLIGKPRHVSIADETGVYELTHQVCCNCDAERDNLCPLARERFGAGAIDPAPGLQPNPFAWAGMHIEEVGE